MMSLQELQPASVNKLLIEEFEDQVLVYPTLTKQRENDYCRRCVQGWRNRDSLSGRRWPALARASTKATE